MHWIPFTPQEIGNIAAWLAVLFLCLALLNYWIIDIRKARRERMWLEIRRRVTGNEEVESEMEQARRHRG